VKTCTVSEAARLGADAVSVHVNFFSDKEPEMLTELAKTVEECDELGMPLLVMAYPRGPSVKDEHAADVVAHASRIAEELGADVVKTNYTGDVDSFKGVTQACRIPVVIAGGPKAKSAEDFLRMVHDAIQAGAKGVSIGRNVFQHENPTAMVKALNAIIHEGATLEEAVKVLSVAS
jgi:DhnA family fructose-bisphosphate aldolase class Ia